MVKPSILLPGEALTSCKACPSCQACVGCQIISGQEANEAGKQEKIRVMEPPSVLLEDGGDFPLKKKVLG